MNIDRESMSMSIKEFLGDDGLSFLKQYNDENKFFLAWGSCLYGSIGIQVRNHLIDTYGPEIYADGYDKFEELTTEITLELIA